jgi:hypothetical protein
MRWIVVVALGLSACTAEQARSMGQGQESYSRTYTERGQYQHGPQQAGPFDEESDQQQRQYEQGKQQRQQQQQTLQQQQSDQQQSGSAAPDSPVQR